MSSQLTIRPRFSETDALGHINNTSTPAWFEEGRLHLLQQQAQIAQKTVLAHFEIDYLAEVNYGEDVELRTSITRLGNSSITYKQNVYQGNKHCLRAIAVSVTYDPVKRQSSPMSEDTLSKLKPFLKE